jgi:hypothetical protein
METFKEFVGAPDEPSLEAFAFCSERRVQPPLQPRINIDDDATTSADGHRTPPQITLHPSRYIDTGSDV